MSLSKVFSTRLVTSGEITCSSVNRKKLPSKLILYQTIDPTQSPTKTSIFPSPSMSPRATDSGFSPCTWLDVHSPWRLWYKKTLSSFRAAVTTSRFSSLSTWPTTTDETLR
eukprot:Lithocolla_globosa_v1_NODE_345_length_4393_cov_6.676349.p8 type:complete len:111 gc:universal NODE_345_length_4393_cov_6.676349:2424-2092(-)